MISRLYRTCALLRATVPNGVCLPQLGFESRRLVINMGTGSSKSKRGLGVCGTVSPKIAAVGAIPGSGGSSDVPDGFVRAKKVRDLPATGLTRFDLAKDLPLVIITKGGTVEGVLYSLCPHKKADLAIGDIEDADVTRGCSVKCPKHRKKYPGGLNFSARDGKSWVADASVCDPSYNSEWAVPSFAFRMIGDWLCISKEPISGVVPPPPVLEELPAGTGTGAGAGGGSGAGAGASTVSTLPPSVADVDAAASNSAVAAAAATLPTAALAARTASGFVPAKRLDELPSTGLTRFDLDAETPLVIMTKDGAVQGVLYALCPHKKADLSIGDIEDGDAGKGCSVKCPRHRKKYPGGLNFAARDGKAWVADAAVCDPSFDSDWSVPTFGWKIDGDMLLVSVEPTSGVVPPLPPPEEEAAAAGGAGDGGKEKQLKKDKKEKEAEKSKRSGVIETEITSVGGSGAAVAAAAAPPAAASLALASTGDGATIAVSSVALPSSSAAEARQQLQLFPAKLLRVMPVNHDSSVYRFAVLAPRERLAAAAGSCDPHCWHVELRLRVLPEAASAAATPASAAATGVAAVVDVCREYTPVSPLADLLVSGAERESTVDLLIKHYERGALTSQLLAHASKAPERLLLEVSPPRTTVQTPFVAEPSLSPLPPLAAVSSPIAAAASAADDAAATAALGTATPPSTLLLVGGGTGITPLMQLATWALALTHAPAPTGSGSSEGGSTDGSGSSSSSTSTRIGSGGSHVALVYSSRTPADVLMHEAIGALARAHPHRFTVTHCITRISGAGDGSPASAGASAAGRSDSNAADLLSAAGIDGGAGLPNVTVRRSRVNAEVLRQAAAALGSSTSAAAAGLVPARIVISGPDGFAPCVGGAAAEANLVPTDWAAAVDDTGMRRVVELEA